MHVMTRGGWRRLVEPTDLGVYAVVIVANTVLFVVAGFFYAGHFAFWVDPLGYLGAAVSTAGLENTVARAIYAAAMLLSGAVMIAHTTSNPHRRAPTCTRRLHTALTPVCGVRFVIAGFSPDDTQHRLPVLGSTMLVTAPWLLAPTTLYAVRIDLGRRRYRAAHLVLHGPILIYAALLFAGQETAAAIAQKPTLLAIAAVLLYKRHGGQPHQRISLPTGPPVIPGPWVMSPA